MTPKNTPDFIIGGAPKCGTTTLHFILDQHPDISLPWREVAYFDADDPITHNDFFRTSDGKLSWFNPDADLTENATPEARYYTSRFAEFGSSKLVGEDSTTYIFSNVAARRIRKHLPDVKLVFMLRNPVKRAYSQYWHLMNSARTTLSFEQALARVGNIVLGSTYTSNLQAYFDLFPREQIKVVLFEEFIEDLQVGIDDVTEHIGAAHFEIDPENSWFNKTLYTKHVGTQRFLNNIARPFVAGRYRTHMKDEAEHTFLDRVNNKLHDGFFNHVYPKFLNQARPPAMNEGTREFLEHHMTARNQGLSDLLERDVSGVWGLDV